LAYLLFARGLAGLGVGTTATLTLAEPATAATLGIVVLDERLTLPAAGGVALIAAGLAVLAIGGLRRTGPPQDQPFRNIGDPGHL
jgi:DME family drug/metabolite transporter